MPLQFIGRSLSVHGDPQTAGMAMLELSNRYQVFVRVVGVPGGHLFSPIEQTLPPHILEQIEQSRQQQREQQAKHFALAIEGTEEESVTALSRISLLETKLHEPLQCLPIERRGTLSIWAPGLLDVREPVLAVGAIANIVLLP